MRPGLGQSGALFGLDARIALAIFSIISVVAGATMVLNMDSMRAKALGQELTETGRAIEAIHGDLKADIFMALDRPSEKNAAQALFDRDVLTETDNLRARWSGPYIKFSSTRHPRFGEMVLQKRGANHVEACNTIDICYLWLVYGTVKSGIVEETNIIIDGEKEENPSTSGRLQWTEGGGEPGTSQLYFRAARALVPDLE